MKNAFITGGSSGLGLALADELARRGYRVALAARRTDLLEQEVARLTREGRTAMALTVDVVDPVSVRAAVQITERTWGPLDLAIANAGISKSTWATRMVWEDVNAIMNINFNGMVHLYQAVIPGMLARKQGRFAGVASLAGLRGLPTNAAYSASKAAMQAFLEAVRIELQPHGIGVSTINPGFVRTPMTAKHKYPMPFLMNADKAAIIMADGLEKGTKEIEYPFATAAAMRIARLLPNAVYDRISAKGAERNRDEEKVPR